VDIILVRHGETEWNVGEVFRGCADIDLNENGRNQATLLGTYLADTGIQAVLSSPLKRALDTARAIAVNHGLKVQVSDGLNDLDFGEWEGLAVTLVRDRYGELFAEWSEHPERVRLPGGETLDDVRHRSMLVVEKVIGEQKGAVALVTHRVVIKVLVCALLGLDNSHFWNVMVDTCGVTTFRFEKDHFVLIRHNDNNFLKSLHIAPLKDF
jgi:broad specificity phosphatase PhoE